MILFIAGLIIYLAALFIISNKIEDKLRLFSTKNHVYIVS